MITYRSVRIPENSNYFTNFDFFNSLNIGKSYFDNNHNLNRVSMYGQFTKNEAAFLNNFVRDFLRPKKVMEFSPCYGYTTCLISAGLMQAGITPEYFCTHEIVPACFEGTKKHLSSIGANFVTPILGDVLETMDLEKLKNCDFLFVDSDHDPAFCQKYTDKFFPLVAKGTWVGVHDICFSPLNEETSIITNWMKQNGVTKYFFLPDVLSKFEINDDCVNELNPKNYERSSTLWFQR